jgi:hypothetical protein
MAMTWFTYTSKSAGRKSTPLMRGLWGHPARTGWPLAVGKALTGRAGFFLADRETGGGISGWRIGSC